MATETKSNIELLFLDQLQGALDSGEIIVKNSQDSKKKQTLKKADLEKKIQQIAFNDIFNQKTISITVETKEAQKKRLESLALFVRRERVVFKNGVRFSADPIGIRLKPDSISSIIMIPLKGFEETKDIHIFDKYILTGVQWGQDQRFQVVTTEHNPVLFFFGDAPESVVFECVLLNSSDHQWLREFFEFYNTKLKATVALNEALATFITLDSIIIRGYFLKYRLALDASNENTVRMTFEMFVKQMTIFNPEGLENESTLIGLKNIQATKEAQLAAENFAATGR